MVKYLQTIKEEEEHDVEGKENTFEMMNMSPAPGGGEFSPDKRKSLKKRGQGGSFIGGSFIGGDGPAAAPETEE
jgi:hypothetical protein|tara:strand:+ start:76 stop:297 length:222 start_codon:yes stop_codon:yes gene_type:complete